MDPAVSLLRREGATRLDRLERAGEAFFRRVYDAFTDMAVAEPERFHAVDASKSVEEVAEAVYTAAMNALSRHILGDLKPGRAAPRQV